jgi:glycosyltransferase involved in cell wall biosynthesis
VRILLALGWYFPDSLGGTEVYVRGLARHLQAEGHDVRIAAPRAGDRTFHQYEHDAVRVFRYPVPSEPTRTEAQGVVTAGGAEHLHRYVAEWRPEIFHAHSLVTGLGLHELSAARRAGAHVVYTNHLPSMGFVCLRGTLLRDGRTPCDGLQEEAKCGACLLQQRDVPLSAARGIAALPSSLARTLSWIPRPAGTALGIREVVRSARLRQQQLIEVCDRIVVLNDWAAEIFRANGAPPAKVVVNRLGVSHPNLQRKPLPVERPSVQPITVGYVGRFHEVKGLHVLAEAMRHVSPEVPLRLHIAGPADDPHAQPVLRNFREATAHDDRVTIGPAVLTEAIGDHLRSLDVLCCPSLWFENGPTIALEAMAVGTPVIGTRLGAFVEIIADGINGRLVAPGDAKALAAALCEVATRSAETVDAWRKAIGTPRTMREIASDYLATYRELESREVAAP